MAIATNTSQDMRQLLRLYLSAAIDSADAMDRHQYMAGYMDCANDIIGRVSRVSEAKTNAANHDNCFIDGN